MAQVTFSYTGQLANAAGESEVVLDLPDEQSDLRPVLDLLAARHGESWRELVLDAEGRIRSTLLVVIDGVQAAGDKQSLSLTGAGNVMLMTPIAGG